MSKKHNKPEKIKIPLNDLDICIAVYGNYEILQKNIDALADACQDIKYKIYLCDDKSPDLEEKGRDFYKTFKERLDCGAVRYNNENKGFPFTANIAVNSGRSPYILILNSDIILAPHSIKIMLDHLKANNDIGIISPLLTFFPNSDKADRPAGRVQHCFISFDILQRPMHQFVGWDAEHPFVRNKVRDINAVSGACFLTRRNLWNQIGGFDLQFGKGVCEDVAYCLETRLRGFKIRYIPQATGYHFTGMSAERYNQPFPINDNFQKLKVKYKDVIPYDNFLFAGL